MTIISKDGQNFLTNRLRITNLQKTCKIIADRLATSKIKKRGISTKTKKLNSSKGEKYETKVVGIGSGYCSNVFNFYEI